MGPTTNKSQMRGSLSYSHAVRQRRSNYSRGALTNQRRMQQMKTQMEQSSFPSLPPASAPSVLTKAKTAMFGHYVNQPPPAPMTSSAANSVRGEEEDESQSMDFCFSNPDAVDDSAQQNSSMNNSQLEQWSSDTQGQWNDTQVKQTV